MTILSQIREEASAIADSMPLEIIEKAEKNLAHNRFLRLRRGNLPETQKEIRYLQALEKYVYFKLAVRRGDRLFEFRDSKYWNNKESMLKWRGVVDSIESEPTEITQAYLVTPYMSTGSPNYFCSSIVPID